MSVPVCVDLESAVVSYRPAAGEERSSSAGKVSIEALLLAAPWRTFRWYFGQHHYSGTYWSSTQGDHVIYESRLELANLLLADFDSQVRQIVAQPFIVCAEVQGQARKHIVDYLWGTADGPVVVDVVRAERISHPRINVAVQGPPRQCSMRLWSGVKPWLTPQRTAWVRLPTSILR